MVVKHLCTPSNSFYDALHAQYLYIYHRNGSGVSAQIPNFCLGKPNISLTQNEFDAGVCINFLLNKIPYKMFTDLKYMDIW